MKRRRLFALFAMLSLLWLSLLLYVMHSLRLDEHVSMQDNLDFMGADIGSKYGIESASECSHECEAHPSCFAFTYVKSERACWLKREGYLTKSNPNTISGSINATLAIERRRAANQTEATHPQEGEEWAYNEFDNRRFPGDDYNGGDFGEGISDSRSIITEEDVEKYEDSTTFFGNVQLHTMVRSPADCEQFCIDNVQCVAWTLDKYQLLCMLRLAETQPLRFLTDFISGALSSAQLQQRYAEWKIESINGTEDETTPYNGAAWRPMFPQSTAVLDNTDLLGGDLLELRDVDSVNKCNTRCHQAAPNCSAWTLSKHMGSCWLKSGAYIKKSQNRSAGLISGELNTRAAPPNDSGRLNTSSRSFPNVTGGGALS